MALNPVPVGDAIAAYVVTQRPTAGTPVTDAQLRLLWEGIMNIIYNDLKTNLELQAGSFTTGVGGGAVTGLGGPAV